MALQTSLLAVLPIYGTKLQYGITQSPALEHIDSPLGSFRASRLVSDVVGRSARTVFHVTILAFVTIVYTMASKYDEEWLEREFIGYGYNTPDPKWPKGAKICVSFVVQFNMGAVSLCSCTNSWHKREMLRVGIQCD